MNALFLDIDGVLNNYHLQKSFTFPNGYIQNPVKGTQNKWNGLMGMDYDKVTLLNKILENNDWKVIISSSWYYSVNTVKALENFGFKYTNRIIGGTDRKSYGRGKQILDAVEYFKVKDFIILDDELFDITGNSEFVSNNMREIFRDRVFETNPYIGLTEKTVSKILKRLNHFMI